MTAVNLTHISLLLKEQAHFIKMTAVNLMKVSLLLKELSTFSTINFSIKMTAANSINISLFPEELSTFSTISHFSMKMTAVTLIRDILRNYTHLRRSII